MTEESSDNGEGDPSGTCGVSPVQHSHVRNAKPVNKDAENRTTHT